MAPPKNVKEVKNLNGKIVALNRFLSRAMDKCLPFFSTLKKSFEWTAECQQEFEDLKVYLSSPPLLSPSQPREELFLYLVVSPTAISAALVKKTTRSRSQCTTLAGYFVVQKKGTCQWRSLPSL